MLSLFLKIVLGYDSKFLTLKKRNYRFVTIDGEPIMINGKPWVIYE